jgi:two-component system, cell cycle sensor histidine kinase and response regulator CckA
MSFVSGPYEIVDVNDVVREIARVLARLVGDEVRLILRLDASLARVEADASGIELVLLNLALSSLYATEAGGTIAIHTANVDVSQAISRGGRQVPPGTYARVSVEDARCGRTPVVPASPLAAAFADEAPPGEDVDLFVCSAILGAHGGEILIEGKPGHGTRTDVYLPTRHPAALAAAANTAPASTIGGGQHA